MEQEKGRLAGEQESEMDLFLAQVRALQETARATDRIAAALEALVALLTAREEEDPL